MTSSVDYRELIKRTAVLCGYHQDISFSERTLHLSGTGMMKWNFFTSVLTSVNLARAVVECENNRALAESYIDNCKLELPERRQSYTGFVEEVAKHEEHDFKYLAEFSIQRNILTSFTGQSARYFEECPRCAGTGSVLLSTNNENRSGLGRDFVTCINCGGTGRVEHYLTPCFQAHSELINNFSTTPREWLDEIRKASDQAVYAHVIENSEFAKAGPLEYRDGKFTQSYTVTVSYVCYEFSICGTDYKLYKFANSDTLLNQYQTLFCDVLLGEHLTKLKKACSGKLSSSRALSLIRDLQSIELFRQISEYYGKSQGKNIADEISRLCKGFIRRETAAALEQIMTKLFSSAAPTSDIAWKATATALGLLPLWGVYSVCEYFEAGIFGTVLYTFLGIPVSIALMFCSRPFAVLIDRFLTYRKRRLLPNGKSIKFQALRANWQRIEGHYIRCGLISALAYQFLPTEFRLPSVFSVLEKITGFLSTLP